MATVVAVDSKEGGSDFNGSAPPTPPIMSPTKTDSKEHATMSSVGPKWRAMFADPATGMFDEKDLPIVEVCVKVTRMADLEVKAQTATIDFTLMLDWWDVSLNDATEKTEDSVDISGDHFMPRVFASNGKDGPVDLTGDLTFKLRPEPNHVTATGKFSLTVFSLLSLHRFPFDTQYLDLRLEVKPVTQGLRWRNRKGQTTRDGKAGGRGIRQGWVHLSPPVTFRPKKGIELMADADMLGEWDLIGICGDMDHRGHVEDEYSHMFTVQVTAARDSMHAIWNLFFPMMVIVAVSLFAYCMGYTAAEPQTQTHAGSNSNASTARRLKMSARRLQVDASTSSASFETSALADRMSLVSTMMLAAMAFKWVISDALPNVPYLTTLEYYVVCCLGIIFLQGMLFLPVHVLTLHGHHAEAASVDLVSIVVNLALFLVIHVYVLVVWKLKPGRGDTERTLVDVKDEIYSNERFRQKGEEYGLDRMECPERPKWAGTKN